MAARGNIFHAKNSTLQKFLREISIRIGGHLSVRRQKSRLGANHNLVAPVAFVEKLAQGRTHRALASLETVVNRGVHHVDPALHRRSYRIHVRAIGRFIRLTQISSNADRRKHQPAANLAKMSSGRAPLNPPREPKTPPRGRPPGLASAIRWRYE